MASGEVRELRIKKPLAKFLIGDGTKTYWNEVFEHNPYIIKDTEIHKHDEVYWIKNYEGNRPYRNYGDHLPKKNYNWKKEFKAKKGEIFFSTAEKKIAKEVIFNIRKKIGNRKLVFIEPNVKKRLGYENRDWGFEKWQNVVNELKEFYDFLQITYGSNKPINGSINIHGLNFRTSVAILSLCDLFIGTEGGMHHAAAATDRQSIVIYGGHISPEITGYDFQKNLYIQNYLSPCGSKELCDHCQDCLKKITTEDLIAEIKKTLNN